MRVSTTHPSEKKTPCPGVAPTTLSPAGETDDSSSALFSVFFSVFFSALCRRNGIFLGESAGAAALGSRLGLKHVARVELDRPNMRGLRAGQRMRFLSRSPPPPPPPPPSPSPSPSPSHCRTCPPLSGRCPPSAPQANRRPPSCWQCPPRPHRCVLVRRIWPPKTSSCAC